MKIKDLINRYVAYRRSLGEKFKTNASVLSHFGRYVGEHTEFESLTEEKVTGYLYSGNDTVTANWFGRYGAMKGFLTWCMSRGHTDKWLLTDIVPKRPEHIVPYIYSNAELKLIFANALTYQKNRSTVYPECVQAILMTTYFLGLRIHETMSLKMRDINMEESYAHIRESKFYKSRIVTFNRAVKSMLLNFFEWRRTHGMPKSPDTGVWLNRRNEPMNKDTVHGIFGRIRSKAGIRRDDGAVYQPRLHDLRHAFAVNRLRQWYEKGIDVQKMLPSLSTYMGHKHLSHTSVYLTMTDNILQLTSQRFEEYAMKKGDKT